MVDWYYIFSILWWGVYPSPQSIYNVDAKTTYYFVYLVDLVCLVYLFNFTNYIHFINLVCHAHICHGSL